MMKKIMAIARWEYLEKVKTKTFIISLIITPLLIISFSVLPSILFRQDSNNVQVLGIIDKTGEYFQKIEERLQLYFLPDGQNKYVLINLTQNNQNLEEMKKEGDRKVLKNLLEGYLIIQPRSKDSILAEYRSDVFRNAEIVTRLEETLNSARVERILESEGIRSNIISQIQDRTIVQQYKIEEEGRVSESDFLTTFFLSIVFILLLMMMVIYSGQLLVRSMIEEKSSRLIELLVSSSTPDELLAGKVIGLSLLGLTQIAIWAIIGLGLAGSALVPITAFKNVLPMLIYFILGFLFYTTLFVGIGSTVTTEQQAQQITTYLSLILMLPVVIAMPVIQNPDFIVTKIFSYIPLTIPTVMVLRLNVQNVSTLEIVLTILILILSILIVTKISAKIFRIGILSYGNKLSFKEIINWLKE
ncbi:MAG: ABC transporter permease [Ignavibacteriaceae bacterium]